MLSRVQFFARQGPLSMGFPRQEYWSGLPYFSPGDLPNPGIELRSPALQANSLPTELSGKLNVQFFVILWTIAHQAPLSTDFSRQEYWSEFPCHPPEDLPDLGIKLGSPALQMDSLPAELPGKPKSKSKSKAPVKFQKESQHIGTVVLGAM